MNNSTIEVGKRYRNFTQDRRRIGWTQYSACTTEMLAQGFLGTGHDQSPTIFVLAAVYDRYNATGSIQLDEQHLSLGTWRLGNQLNNGLHASGVLGFENSTKATRPNRCAHDPLLIELYDRHGSTHLGYGIVRSYRCSPTAASGYSGFPTTRLGV